MPPGPWSWIYHFHLIMNSCWVHLTLWLDGSNRTPLRQFQMHGHLGLLDCMAQMTELLIPQCKHAVKSFLVSVYPKIMAFEVTWYMAEAVFLYMECVPPSTRKGLLALCCLLCDSGWKIKQAIEYIWRICPKIPLGPLNPWKHFPSGRS